MIATLLVYSGFTGLSGTAGTVTQLIVYRFLVGLGVGGMFGAATTLVAESVPANFRTLALGSLQALSAMGNVTGSMISWFIRPGTPQFLGDYSGWRVLFFVGILPSLLVIPIILVLREPDAWKQAKAEAASGDAKKKVGDINELFKNPRWRRNSLCGLGLGAAGMIGLWAIGFFSPELITMALKDLPQTKVDSVKALGTGLQDTGAFIGMLVFTWVAARLNRRKAFLGAFLLCFIVTVFVFNMLKKESHAYWMLPMMGFAQLSVFAGYSIYFPELFPTRLRGSGVGLCYNTVRCITALFLFFSGFLKTLMPFRTAATVMSVIFLLGIVVLIWAPETKGKPLPEG
jgi:MFS family permease